MCQCSLKILQGCLESFRLKNHFPLFDSIAKCSPSEPDNATCILRGCNDLQSIWVTPHVFCQTYTFVGKDIRLLKVACITQQSCSQSSRTIEQFTQRPFQAAFRLSLKRRENIHLSHKVSKHILSRVCVMQPPEKTDFFAI